MKLLRVWLSLTLGSVILWLALSAFAQRSEAQATNPPSPNQAAATTLANDWTPDADTYAVAWGDMDGDGDLDLAVGNVEGQNKVYLNEGGALQETPAWQALSSNYTVSLAWGDLDNDGDLDLAVGNCGNLVSNEYHYTYVQVYLNVDGMLQTTPVWTTTGFRYTRSVAWGDMNGDGYLDLAVGNSGYQNDRANTYNQVYLNVNGMLAATPAWTSAVFADTRSVAWGDADGDGDLDLAVANVTHIYDPAQSVQIYRNDNGMLQTMPIWTAPDNIAYGGDAIGVAWADYGYNDARLDLVVTYPSAVVIYEYYGSFPSF